MRLHPDAAAALGIMLAVSALYLWVAQQGTPAASGLFGHGLGIVGFLLMAIGTGGYAWRKRRSGPGSMQRWLQVHVVSGLVGPYLVFLHTGFAFRGVAGVSFLLVAVVVASGIIGRFVYTGVPKPPPAYAAVARRRWSEAVESLALRQRVLPAARAASLPVETAVMMHHAWTAERRRRTLAVWWLLHVPLALAMFVLALVHVAGALYYATLLR